MPTVGPVPRVSISFNVNQHERWEQTVIAGNLWVPEGDDGGRWMTESELATRQQE